MPTTNATIRYASPAKRPDQRAQVLRYWEIAGRQMVEVSTGVAGATVHFARKPPNTVWVRVEPSSSRPGKFRITRQSWLVPDADAIEAAHAVYMNPPR